MTEDEKAIARSLEGDSKAFDALVRRYQLPIYALALQRVGSTVEAEAIAQEVFVRAYLKLGQLRDASRFGAWLRSITLRECGMWLRSPKRRRERQEVSLEQVGDGLLTAPAVPDAEGILLEIDALILGLPERLRAAAVLCLKEELAPAEAADVLGIKPGTLRKRLHDARARLQRQIVERAEAQLELHLMPGDFAERCICRCEKARNSKARKEVSTVAKKKDCGCGCMSASKAKSQGKAGKKTKVKKEK